MNSIEQYQIDKYVTLSFVKMTFVWMVTIVITCLLSAALINDGGFDWEFFFLTLISFSLMSILMFKHHFRTLIIKKNSYIYKSLFRIIIINYEEIVKVELESNIVNDKQEYYLIIHANNILWKISEINHYRRKDIEIFINKIYQCSSTSFDKDLLEKKLLNIEWPEDKKKYSFEI